VTPFAFLLVTWVFIVLPLLVVWAIGLVDILRRDYSWKRKTLWILVVLLLPVVGTITYFLVRKPTQAEIDEAVRARNVSPR
jgi:hypothetical protein